jgi:hypothetical protein
MTERTVFVEVLTDEELAVLARPHALALAPYLDELDPEQRQLAQRTAYRGLLARGIVDQPTAAAVAAAEVAGDGSVELMVRRDVRSVLALREGAGLAVAVARTASSGRDYWYAYLVDEVLLLEEISSEGLHRFALARAEQLLDLTVAAAVHPDSGDTAGHPVAVPAAADAPPPAPVLGQLGQALLRADVVVRHVREREAGTLEVFTGPHGCWLVTGRGGPVPMAHPLSADALRSQLRGFVERVLAEAGATAVHAGS